MKLFRYETDGVTCMPPCPYGEKSNDGQIVLMGSHLCAACPFYRKVANEKNSIVLCAFEDACGSDEQLGQGENLRESDAVNSPKYYNRYSVEVVEMARRIWGDEAMKTAAEITAFIYRMRAGIKPDNPWEQDIGKEEWWLNYRAKI